MTTENIHLLSLIGIMLVCGFMGGLVNYWGEDIAEERYPLLKRLSAGVAAAFVVPLFLNMISSSLIEDSLLKPRSLLIFAGFCIIASLSSKAFIESITRKLLSRVDKVEEDQNYLSERVVPVIEAQTEPQPDKSTESESVDNSSAIDKVNDYSQGLFRIEAYGTDDDYKKVIKALDTEKYTWRYPGGIAVDAQLPKEQIETTLNWLKANGFTTETHGKRGQLWALSAKGRDLLASILAAEKARKA